MKTIFTKSFLFIILLMLIHGDISGQQADTSRLDNLSLKDLLNVKITTASKTSQSLRLASAVVTVITKEQIRARGYQSLLDVMHDLTDVKVDDKIYSVMRNSFTIRGIQGTEKFVILLDGINITTPSGEAMAIMQNYPVHLAEQIEIMFGPASALYGANAVSGIINIITKKTGGKKLMIEASSVAGDHGYTNTTLFISKKISDNVRFVASGQYYYDRNPDYSKLYKNDSISSVAAYGQGTFNTVFGPFTPSEPVTAKYEAPMQAYNIYTALHAGDFSFSFFKNYFRTPSAWGSNTLNAIFNKDAFIGQSITTMNASYKKTFNKITSSTLLTSSRYNIDPASNYRNLYTAMERAYKYSVCTMIKFEEQFDYKASEKLGMTAGAGFEDYNAIPHSADLAKPVDKNSHLQGNYLGTASYYKPEGLQAPFYFIRYQNVGAYFQAQYSPTSKINLTLGTRYDHNSQYGSSFNPRMGVVYELSEKTTIKLLYGSAFRAPAPSELYSQYGSFYTADSGRTYRSYFLHLPNPGLKPITSHNTELNIQQRLSDNVFFTVDAFYTTLRGLYDYSDDNQSTHLYNNQYNGIPVDYIEVFTNNNRQKNYGGSVQLNWKKSLGTVQLNSFASFSYVKAVSETGLKEAAETTKDKEAEFVSPWMVHMGTDLKAGKFSCSPRLTLMGRQHIAGLGDTTGHLIKRQTNPGYALLNVSMRYNISKKVSVFTNVSNALNQRYRNVSFNMDLKKETDVYNNGQPQDPIRIMSGLSFNF